MIDLKKNILNSFKATNKMVAFSYIIIDLKYR